MSFEGGLLGDLSCFPHEVIVEIVSHLGSLTDVRSVMVLNSIFSEIMSGDDLWRLYWQRHFPGETAPGDSIQAAFRSHYLVQDWGFGNWKILRRRGSYLIHNIYTRHTVSALISRGSYTIATFSWAMTWDTSSATPSEAHLVPGDFRLELDSDFQVSIHDRPAPEEYASRRRQAISLPTSGQFFDVHFAVGFANVDEGGDGQYLHIWHDACPVLLLMAVYSNGWVAIRQRAPGEVITVPREPPAGDNVDSVPSTHASVLYPHSVAEVLCAVYRGEPVEDDSLFS